LAGGARFPLQISFLDVERRWQETLIGQLKVCCGETFTNPQANRKQFPVISWKLISVPYG